MPADQQSVHRTAGLDSESSLIRLAIVHSGEGYFIGVWHAIPGSPQAAIHIPVSKAYRSADSVPQAVVWMEIELIRNAGLQGG
jgi:hypothetical protein